MTHILLYGPPGSGKTTLGDLLADSLRLPFIDLDNAIESRAGRPIASIMEESGEPGFREVESSVLCDQLEGEESVVALGGGTLLRSENRALAERKGCILCLRAEPEVLLKRLRDHPLKRPLLAGNLDDRLASLLASRRSHYDSFSEQFDTDAPPEKLIPPLQSALGRFHVSGMGSYPVIIEAGGLDRLGERPEVQSAGRLAIVSDENVARLHGSRVLDSLRRFDCEPAMLVIPAGEASKTLSTVSRLWHGFLEAGLDRKSRVIALGGGVVGDLAGFAASTYMRGIDWVYVPTSLLAMVDASLGGKTGFDLPEGKNLIGTFHAPLLVLSDPEVLSSLPQAEFRAGLAEVVKHGIIGDPQLFEACSRGLAQVYENLPVILRRAAAVKVRIIEADPRERGERAALNLGHTVGHAVELVSGYHIRHGEAVAMGMAAEAKLAERLEIADRGLSMRIAETLSGLGLPPVVPAELPRPELIRAMGSDKKKSAGTVRFSLPVEIGRVQTNVQVEDLSVVFMED